MRLSFENTNVLPTQDDGDDDDDDVRVGPPTSGVLTLHLGAADAPRVDVGYDVSKRWRGASMVFNFRPRPLSVGVQIRALGGFSCYYEQAPDVLEREDGYTTGAGVDDGHLWWEVWSSFSERMRSRAPSWRHGDVELRLADRILGEARRETLQQQYARTEVAFREGSYQVGVSFKRERVKRRWGRARVVGTATIKPRVGVPIPGRGESSYDCDEDAVYGLTLGADSIEDALRQFVEDVLRTREERGGSRDWQPARARTASP